MRVYIDNTAYYSDTHREESVLSFLLSQNCTLPTFCVHNRLDIAGNCRMCLIQVNNDLIASCAVNIMPEMKIFTKTKRVFNARDGVLEFLLVNHPLDCPICDQGGSCDLQDLTFIFGSDRGRFYELKKRSIDNLNNCGPLIKTVMTRCIHCTRCIRFLNYFGISQLGVIGRGQNMEIGSYINKSILLEDQLSANIIDLCPVGALTSMPYAFTARPWELKGIETIDILDSLGAAIRVDIFNNKVMRILPLVDNNVNEEWITNKIRFSYDSFFTQRIYYPGLRFNKNYLVLSWYNSFKIFLRILFNTNKHYIKSFIGPLSDIESCLSIKLFFNSVGCSNVTYYTNLYNNVDFRSSYLLNNSLLELERILFLIIIGANLRMELPLLNARIRKSWINSNATLIVYSFGLCVDYLTYPVLNYSNSMLSLFNLIETKHVTTIYIYINRLNFFKKILFKIPYFFIGLGVLNRLDGNNFFNKLLIYLVNFINNNFNLSTISPFIGRLSALELGLSKTICSSIKNTLVYLSNIFDNKYLTNNVSVEKTNFIIFSGSFKDYFFYNSSMVLPIPIFVEDSLSYLNIEGRLRVTQTAIDLKEKLYNENQIFKYLYLIVNIKNYIYCLINWFREIMIYFETVLSYRCLFIFGKVNKLNKFLTYLGIDTYSIYNYKDFFKISKYIKYLNPIILFNSILNITINNYYTTDFFTKHSRVLAMCASKIEYFSFSVNQYNI